MIGLESSTNDIDSDAAPEGTLATGHIDLATPGLIRQDLALPPLTTLQEPTPMACVAPISME